MAEAKPRPRPMLGSIKIGGVEINKTLVEPPVASEPPKAAGGLRTPGSGPAKEADRHTLATANERRKAQLAALLETLPSRRTIAAQVVWLVDSEDSDSKKIGALIEQDVNLTTRILRVANSAQYGGAKRVVSAQEATTRLGYIFIKSLAAGDALGLYDDSVKPPVPRGFWIHAATIAATASAIARKVRGVPPADAFSAALLHDLGSALLHRCDVREYARLVESAADSESTMIAGELESFGITHFDAAAVVLTAWEFPARLVDAIRDHHRPDLDLNENPLVPIIAAADAIAAGIDGSPMYDHREQPISDLLYLAGIPRDDLGFVEDSITNEAHGIAAAFEA